MFGQSRRPGVFGAGQEFLDTLRQKSTGSFGILAGAHILRPFDVCVTGSTAGKGRAPVRRLERPGIGIVFQRRLLTLRQIHQPRLEQTQHCAAGNAAARQVQRRMNSPGRGGVFRGSGFVTEQRDILQAEFVPQRSQVLLGVPADNRHAVVGHPGPGAGGDLRRHRLGFCLAAGCPVADNGRVFRVHRAIGGIRGVGQQQIQFRQHRGLAVAAVFGQGFGMYRHTGIRGHPTQAVGHRLGTAEQSHPAVTVLGAVAAQADRHIGHRQHGRQQCPFGGVEGIELVDIDRTTGEKRCIQILRRQLLAVAGVHGTLGEQSFVGAVDQRKFLQLVPVRPRGTGIVRQRLGRDARAFQFFDGLGRLLAKSR